MNASSSHALSCAASRGRQRPRQNATLRAMNRYHRCKRTLLPAEARTIHVHDVPIMMCKASAAEAVHKRHATCLSENWTHSSAETCLVCDCYSGYGFTYACNVHSRNF